MSYTLHTLHEEMEITLEHAASTGIDLLRILEALHKKGFVHGDIKPANIGIKVKKGRGFPAILDFGNTKRWKAQAAEPPLVRFNGTVGFASVNALANQAPSPRDDVISLMYSLIYVLNDGLPWITGRQDTVAT
ncbi:kinase-like protein [Athelia psychrophila]|uniref:Kinase-like protein n=1 Tax=Athelia psychrophila TaxID=1759441 RepID=A0A165WPQ1_9AGAM|nr:kinase-like protein [Fibularhizoctonia sp. CBS 109695]